MQWEIRLSAPATPDEGASEAYSTSARNPPDTDLKDQVEEIERFN
jgi:hypothetical protein